MLAASASGTTSAEPATAAAPTSTREQRATRSDGMTRRASRASIPASRLLRRSDWKGLQG